MNYETMSYDSLTQKGRVSFKEVPLATAAKYSGEDVYITHKLYTAQKEKNVTENSILTDIEFPLIQVLADMEINGVYINRDILK